MIARTRQSGLAAAALVVVLILVLIALIAGSKYFDAGLGLDQRAATEASFRRIQDALVQHATQNRRLPCPANGATDDGLADPPGASQNCTFPDGVIPWATLALRRSDAIDGWGRKISYRVYAGPTGFTQSDGLTMTDCNTNAGAAEAVDANGLCPATRQTPPAAFLAGKGIAVQTAAGTTTGLAYVLISHGESGLGGYSAEGGTRKELPPAGAIERTNTLVASPYQQRDRSAPGVVPTDLAFFDDILVSATIDGVIAPAKLAARDWGPPAAPPPIASASFDAPTVAAALGVAPGSLDPLTNANTGQNDVDFGAFRVRAFGSSGRNVSFGQGASGVGIGSIGTGTNSNNNATINDATDESLRFQFTNPGRYLGITLIDFGTQSSDLERVRFTFNVGGSTVQITKTACRTGDVLANFTVNPGGDFDEVYVEARSTVSFVDSSRFLIKAIATCPSTSPACKAPGAAAGDDCP